MYEIKNIFILFILIFITFSCSKQGKPTSLQPTKNAKTTGITLSYEDTLDRSYSFVLYHQEPIDESDNDSLLNKTIQVLKRAISQQDTVALNSLMDSNIVSSWGGGIYGKKDLWKHWEKDTIWTSLAKTINFGGLFEQDKQTFSYPYYKSNRCFNNVKDNDEYNTIYTKQRTSVYERPDTSSNKLQTISNEYLSIDMTYQEDDVFHKVISINKLGIGFVSKVASHPLSDLILILKYKNEEWKITAFSSF